MRSDENLTVVKEFYEGDFIRGRSDRLGDYFDPDFVDHDPPRPGLPPGPGGVRAVMDMLAAAMPDRALRLHELFGDGDRVAIRFSISGSQTGPFMGQPPTGGPLTLEVIAILRLAAGRIVERWGRVEARRG